MFATLATVMETKTDVKEVTIISMQSLKVGNRSLEVGIETQSMVEDVSVAQGESLNILKKEELKKQNEMERAANQTKDPGAKKTASLYLIKTVFAVSGEGALILQEVQKTFVEGTLLGSLRKAHTGHIWRVTHLSCGFMGRRGLGIFTRRTRSLEISWGSRKMSGGRQLLTICSKKTMMSFGKRGTCFKQRLYTIFHSLSAGSCPPGQNS